MIAVVYAHPYPRSSRACAALLAAIRELPGAEVRSLYELYPDFDIDADAERAALERARLVVWLHPLYWYTAPALLKLWFEKVLARGWAYGEGASALHGKACLWVVATGGESTGYAGCGEASGLARYAPVVEQTARDCGLRWLDPFLAPGARHATDDELRAAGARLRERIEAWSAAGGGA